VASGEESNPDAEKPTNELDFSDKETAEAGNSLRPFGQTVRRLKEIFLGKGVEAIQRAGPPIYLHGPQADRPAEIVPFLYFHPSIVLEVCPNCNVIKAPEGLEPFLARKLLTIVVNGAFDGTPQAFQELSRRYPGLVVGPRSYWEYRYYSLNKVPHGGSMASGHHYCTTCIRESLEPLMGRVQAFDEQTSRELLLSGNRILDIPHYTANAFADRFVEIVGIPSLDAARELRGATMLGSNLVNAAAWGAVPQVSANLVTSQGGLARSLRIDMPDGAEIEEYLDVAAKFRGVLSLALVPSDPSRVLKVAADINGEVDRISTLRRAVLHQAFASRLGPGILPVAGSLVAGGRYAAEGVEVAGRAIASTSWGKRVWGKFLGDWYYGVAPDVIHIWRLQQELRHSGESARKRNKK
jgi:hypothetical protein